MGLLSVLASFLTLIYVTNAQAIGRGTVRLYSNNSTSSSLTAGIVQIYYGNSTGPNTWGNICEDDSFGHNEADVICNQLGYDGASTYGKVGSTTNRFGTDSLDTIIDDITCSDNDFLTLQQCSIDTTISSTCGDSNDAFVVCYSNRIWDTPYSGQIRLQNGSNSSYGRLEVYCNGQWGTVCDDSFSATDARVACRQLGYSDSYTYTSTDDLDGSDTRAVWLSNVDCSSDSQSCLAYCAHCPTAENQPQCSHSRVISLGCEFNPDYPAPTNTLETCRYADDIASVINDLAAIIGGVVAVFIVCCVLIITIPMCVCCCLGVGVGALIGGSTRRTQPQQTPATIEAGAGLSNTRKNNPLSGTHPPPSTRQNGRHPAQRKTPPTHKVSKQSKPEDDITMQVCEPYNLHKASPDTFNDESPAPQEDLPPPIEELPPPASPEEESTVAVKEVPQEESPPPPQKEEIQEISPPKAESPPSQDEDEIAPPADSELPPPEVPSQDEVPPPPSQDEAPPPEDNEVPPQDEVPPPPQDEASLQDYEVQSPPQDDEVSPPQDAASLQDYEVSPPQDDEVPPQDDEASPPQDEASLQEYEVSPPQDDEVSPPQDLPPQEVNSPEVQEAPAAAAAPQEEMPQQEEPVQQENSTMQEKEEEQPPTEI